jgi:hypothetical protein
MPQCPTIVKAAIGPMPRPMPAGMCDPMPSVTVQLSDGTTKTLFQFYPDEISFTEDEILGLTEEQARRLRHDKDIRWLRDP